MKRAHIVHVALDHDFVGADAIEGEDQVHTLLLSRRRAQEVPAELLARFERIGVLDIEGALDVECYERAVEQMITLAEGSVEEFGPPQAVVGLYEYATLPAARLREYFGVPGTDVATALRFRDKVLMKQALRGVVPVPRFLELDARTTPAALGAFCDAVAGPIVLKPTRQAASLGIEIFDDPAELLRRCAAAEAVAGFEVEEFVDGDVCHFDGVVRDGEIRLFSASRYLLGTCYSWFNVGGPLGSVVIDSPELVAKALEFARRALAALGLRDSAFHLEAFLVGDDDFVFLEVAGRVGGLPIPKHFATVYGVDLVGEAIAACLGGPADGGLRTHLDLQPPGVGASGYVHCALPGQGPRRVRAVHGLDDIPDSVVDAEIPAVGDVRRDGTGMACPAGTFILTGPSGAAVEKDIHRIVETYRLDTDAL
jgi:hypothetical protein